MPTPAHIRKTLLQMAAERGSDATFCPSEVARSLSNDWRPLMDLVRQEAARLVAEGQLVCTQRGHAAHPLTAKGPIRLALTKA